MEIVILAALGGLGYIVNREGVRDRKAGGDRLPKETPKSRVGAWYLDDDRDAGLLKEDMTLYEKRYRDSFDPAATGIIAAGHGAAFKAEPYFSSERKQHTSAFYKQSRMELFTGANKEGASETGHYRNKEERAPLFTPKETKQRVTSGGSAGNPMPGEDRRDRYIVAPKFHHMRPAEEVRVGPGLNTAPDVPATGGFHQFFRVMPKNVGEYKKNNLPGNVIPGKRAVPEVPKHGAIFRKNAVDREMETRGYTGTKSAGFNLGAARPDVTEALDVANTLQDQPWYGVADAERTRIRAPYGDMTNFRDDDTDRGKTAVTNLTDADTGLGAYATRDVQVRDTDRGWRGPAGFGGDDDGTAGTGFTGVRGPTATYIKDTQRNLAPTNRSVTNTIPSGGPLKHVPDIKVRESVNPQRPTNRETTHGYRVGGAGTSDHRRATDRYAVVKNVDKAKARRDNTNYSLTTGPERINRPTNDPGTLVTNKTSNDARYANMSSMDTSSRVVPTIERRNALPASNPVVVAG